MKLKILLLILICLLYGYYSSFSQVVKPGLHEMIRMLGKTTVHSQRADIYFTISKYYADKLKVDSAIFYSKKIEEESKAAGYEKGMAKYYLAKSYAQYLRFGGDIPELLKALEIFQRNKDTWFTGYTYRQLARQYERTDYSDSSRYSFRKSIEFLSKTNDLSELQWVYHELGKSFYTEYEPDSSVYYLITSLEIAQKIKNHLSIFLTSTLLGVMYLESGNLEKGIYYAKYAYDRRDGINRIAVRALLIFYTRCMLLSNEFKKAAAAIKEYESINEKMNDGWGNVNLILLKGIYQYHTGNYKEALTWLRQAYDRRSEIGDFGYDLRYIYSYLAKTEYESGMYDDAIIHFKELNGLANQITFGSEIIFSVMMISRCYEKKGKADSAYQYLTLYDHIKDSIMEFRKQRALMELTTKYESEKKQQHINLLEHEKELSAYQLKSLSQENMISRLEASEKTLAFENQQKEMLKKQDKLALAEKESQLQSVIAVKEAQRKRFAYMAIAAILIFSGYVFFRYSQNKKLSKRLETSLIDLKKAQAQLIKTEKEKEAENIRVRISRDIHDEVGATLSGVALFSEIAREKMKQHKEEDAQAYLEHITVNSKEMVDKMSDIVWAINPDNDSFDKIIVKLQSYTFNLCAGKGIRFQVNIDDTVREYHPPMQVKRNLYLFIKEAINNAVKYAEGKNIFLSLQKEGEYLIASVADDGKGFDNSIDHEGNGIKNMKARANILNGKLVIDSHKNKGTAVRLRFHFHPAGGHSWVA